MEVRSTRSGEGTRSGWVRVTRGVHRRSSAEDPWLAELHAWQRVLPEEARFSHLTAARLHGVWLPPLPRLPVLVSMPAWIPRPRRPGLRVIRPTYFPDPVLVDGLRVEPLTSVALHLVRDLGTLDAVPALDSLQQTSTFQPSELVGLPPRLRGLSRLKGLLGTATDARAESPWESILRVMHHVAGATVTPQHEVFDAEGTFVARGDLRLVGHRVLHEYDGGVHLDVEQQRRDLARARRLVEAGWIRRGYTSYDLTRDPRAVFRDIDSTLGRAPDPRHLVRWRELLGGSCLSRGGRERLTRRLSSLPAVT